MNRPIEWGEVWWLELADIGRRPALVLTRPAALERLPRILVAPATTHRRGLVSEVALDADDGLPQPCVLSLDTPELVSKGLLVEYVATLSAMRMEEVCRALGAAVNC